MVVVSHFCVTVLLRHAEVLYAALAGRNLAFSARAGMSRKGGLCAYESRFGNDRSRCESRRPTSTAQIVFEPVRVESGRGDDDLIGARGIRYYSSPFEGNLDRECSRENMNVAL